MDGTQQVQTAEAPAVEHAEVLAQLDQLESKKPSWRGAVIILIVSMGLFVLAGASQWSWGFVAMLIPVLLFHELGHYIAMRIFRYRNVRMFFIPFFGAAVSGRHYNVPGWKKVIVSLMGPLPGIFVAVVIGAVGVVLQKVLLIKLALVSLILNGFNLLPVLPLDGGWVMHSLFFSRNYKLDAAFRLVAALGLLAGSILLSTRVLMVLGIFMLFGLPAAFRLAKIASDIRQRGLPPALPDDQKIPTQTAQAIIGEVKKAFPKGVTNKIVAQYTMQIFETLNARPPGWGATIGFLALYGGTFFMAALFSAVLLIAREGDLKGFLTAAARAPKHSVACNALDGVRGGASGDIHKVARNTIVATFPRAQEAVRLFGSLTPRVPPHSTLQRFGSSLLLTIPAYDDEARQKWVNELQQHTKDVFVHNTNHFATMSLSCLAETGEMAETIQKEVQEYFGVPLSMHLIPPWAKQDPRTAAQREQHRLARQAFTNAQQTSWSIYNVPAVAALQKQLARAQRTGDEGEAAKLREELRKAVADSRAAALAKTREQARNDVQRAVIDYYKTWELGSTNTYTSMPASNPAGKLMGQLSLAGDVVAPGEDRYAVRWGTVTRNGLLLSFHWVSFANLSEGAPALAEWLCAKGCRELKYEFTTGLGGRDLEEE